jgi:hypothetical protein
VLELLDEFDDELLLELLDELPLEFDDEFELELLDEFDDWFELELLLWFDDELELVLLLWFDDELLGAAGACGGAGRVVGGSGAVVGGAVVGGAVDGGAVVVTETSDWMGTTGIGCGSSRPSHAAATAATRPSAPRPATELFQVKRLRAGMSSILRSPDETPVRLR